ncbi:MAG: RimK/LysX family protein [Pirellulales bacterium]|nr:RimK/LysX family protein [Pirellulales bacterium]
MVPAKYVVALLMLAIPLVFAVLNVRHRQDCHCHKERALHPDLVRQVTWDASESAMRVIGPVVTLRELESELEFVARVDTGAKISSLHAVEKTVVDGAPNMEKNVGKTIRFRVENRRGESRWLTRTIIEVRNVRTSEGEEVCYLVPMWIACEGVEREVLVSLNDRSHMTCSTLLGRNFLQGQFVVDVTRSDASLELLVGEL